MIPVPADEDAFWLGIVGTIVLLTWAYHCQRSLRRSWHDRSYIAARGAFLSIVLMIGLLRIVVGSWVRAYPNYEWLVTSQNALAPILTLLLLSGGVVMIILWKLEDRDLLGPPGD